jgi:hypothetical protein|tara:strand:+ start:217 stop:333 length:117 start_codon:yes stop_codon:yes gene_type:complete
MAPKGSKIEDIITRAREFRHEDAYPDMKMIEDYVTKTK